MKKKYISLGLMSGTSGDGVDASIINSNGIDQFYIIRDKFFEYDSNIYKSFHDLKEKIFNLSDLKKLSKEILDLERKITIFHAKIISDFKKIEDNFLVGFHGQTIYHNSKERVSKQLGDAKLLYQLTRKKIIYNFRKKDIDNGGEGAPLTPIFHQLIAKQKNISLPVCFLNIGGISNITLVKKNFGASGLFSKDIGPGNCLIDLWIRKNSNKKFDQNGKISLIGKTNQIILEQAQELYANRANKKKKSFDTSDFDVSFARGLSLEDGAATLSDFTAGVISEGLYLAVKKSENKCKEILLCGGGRKNKTLVENIKKNLPSKINLSLIDKLKINGDFIESQAFAFLAIRSYLKIPISFPNTTGCKKATLGGELINN